MTEAAHEFMREWKEKLLPLGSAMLHDPLAARFSIKSDATGDNRIYTADDVLGERLGRVGALLVMEAKSPGAVDMNVEDEHRAEALVGFAANALAAEPYLWSEEVRGQVAKLDVPRHVLSPRLLPQPRMWFSFETGIGLGEFLVDLVVVCDHGEGITIFYCGERYDDPEQTEPDRNRPGRPFLDCHSYSYGKVFPDDFDEGPISELSSLLAMFAFLASPFIPAERRQASRAARREGARRMSSQAEQEVTFIMLRRPASRKTENGDEQPVEWKHRWVVSGHLRAQWYPSEQAHHLIWIAPYMKGPEDAPLLEHVFKVAR